MSMTSPVRAIHALDLSFCRMPTVIASYLVVGPTGPVLVESGPGSTIPTLCSRLEDHGYRPEDIHAVLVTHIHLDHAGAAGWWASRGARVYVHHVGAPHLVAPERLLASAGRIYGDMMDALWGEMIPAPAERVIPVYDGDTIEAGGLEFEALDSPGHASHHHAYRLGDAVFTGDLAGIRLPGETFVAMPTPPPEYDLETWLASVDRIGSLRCSRLYPTHFGAVGDSDAHLEQVRSVLIETTELIRTLSDEGVERDELVRQCTAWNRERSRDHEVSDASLARYECISPSGMSVDGVLRYLRKQREGRS